MRCPQCGSEEGGKFCSRCGTLMKARARTQCAKCGSGLESGALFCAECGTPTGHRPSKGAVAYLPWILSAAALAAFAVALTLFIQGQTSQRIGDMPPTGALPVAERVNPDGTPIGGSTAGPGGVDLASMSPRQAADRLFDRVMRVDEAGNEAEAQQFATMAIQAYGMVPPEEMDADGMFHVGLLYLVIDDAESADREADLILSLESEHLLALALKARAAESLGDEAGRKAIYGRFLDALPAGLASGRTEYEMHHRILESESITARELTGRN